MNLSLVWIWKNNCCIINVFICFSLFFLLLLFSTHIELYINYLCIGSIEHDAPLPPLLLYRKFVFKVNICTNIDVNKNFFPKEPDKTFSIWNKHEIHVERISCFGCWIQGKSIVVAVDNYFIPLDAVIFI